MDTDDETKDAFEPASAHLVVSLVDRATTRLRAAGGWVLSIVLSIAGGGPEDGAANVDLSVVRRSTGGEVLRIPGGTLSVADAMLHRVRSDLQTMTVAQFLAEWSPGGNPDGNPHPRPGEPPADGPGPSAGAS